MPALPANCFLARKTREGPGLRTATPTTASAAFCATSFSIASFSVMRLLSFQQHDWIKSGDLFQRHESGSHSHCKQQC